MVIDNVAKGIRNAFILAGFITFIYIVFYFFNGNYIGNRLDGTWRAVCIQDEITFDGNSFIRGQENGEYRIRANFIYFCVNCNGYPIKITARYIVLNGIHYLLMPPDK